LPPFSRQEADSRLPGPAPGRPSTSAVPEGGVRAGNAPVLHSMTDLKFGYNATGCADPLAKRQVGRERIPSMERHPE